MSLRHEPTSASARKLRLLVCGPSLRAVLKVYQWTTVVELKQMIKAQFGVPTQAQTLYYQHCELPNAKALADLGLFEARVKPRLMLSVGQGRANQHIQTCPGSMCETKLRDVVGEVAQGFALGLVPVLTDDGTGGTYFLRNPSKEKVAVFKPMDEEPFCPNNPRDYIGQSGNLSLRKGVLSGEAGYREVAAYLLDYEGFAAVPPTCLAQAAHKNFCYRQSVPEAKQGSLQSFIANNGVIEDYSPTFFSRQEVQKLAILDMRILNLDRNEANILVIKSSRELVPIDHGLSLPDCFEVSKFDLCWMSWPQVKEPITPKACEYVARLDPLEDIRLMKQCLPFRDKCLRNMRIAGILLKKGLEVGLSLYDIGCIMYRNEDEVPSILERAIANAEQIYSLVKHCNLHKSPLSPVKRSRAFSASETELYFGDILKKFDLSTSESDMTDSPVVLGPIEETDEEESELEEVDELPKPLVSAHRRTRSSPVAVLPERAIKPQEKQEAFDEQLFHYIEAFLDQAVQHKVKETKSKHYPDDRSSDSRVRSKSLVQFDF